MFKPGTRNYMHVYGNSVDYKFQQLANFIFVKYLQSLQFSLEFILFYHPTLNIS